MALQIQFTDKQTTVVYNNAYIMFSSYILNLNQKKVTALIDIWSSKSVRDMKKNGNNVFPINSGKPLMVDLTDNMWLGKMLNGTKVIRNIFTEYFDDSILKSNSETVLSKLYQFFKTEDLNDSKDETFNLLPDLRQSNDA